MTKRVRLLRVLAAVVVVVAAAAVGWWAAMVTVAEPAEDSEVAAPVTAEVMQGSVGQSLAIGVAAVQPFGQVASNGLSGVVTAVGDGEVDLGGALYRVGEVDVRAVTGSVPFWRALSQGSRGEDVEQLQRALVDLGYLIGGADGRFGAETTRAVRAWQRDLGRPSSGVVALGEIVAVPNLPDSVRLGEALRLGSVLGGGEPAVFARTGDVRFQVEGTPEQVGRLAAGTEVQIAFEDLLWTAFVSSVMLTEEGGEVVMLSGPNGSSVCGDDCNRLPSSEKTVLRGQVHVVPEISGLSVPVAAISTDASGRTFVVREGGQQQEIVVLASGNGIAIVEGMAEGDRVVVAPGGAQSARSELGEPEQSGQP